jgi:hypothetical protein
MPVVFGILELDASQMLRIVLVGLRGGQRNGLIATQSRGLVHGARVDATKEQIGFAPDDKERLRLMQGEPAGEVGEAAIHDVKAASFGYQDVGYIDLVHLAIGDVDEGGNIAPKVGNPPPAIGWAELTPAQVEQRMHFDGSLGGAEARPRKDAQAQVDGRGIECVGRLLQRHRKAVVGVKLSGDLNKAYREILVDVPVALFVGIGQRALGDVATDTQVAELGSVNAQTGFDVAQAFAVSQLREGHAKKLIEMRKSLGGILGRVTLHVAAECVKG